MAPAPRPGRTAPRISPRPNRIAAAIVRSVKGPIIVRTVQELSDAGAIAPGTLRSWCSAANIKPHDVVAFARALGAVHRAAFDGVDPTPLLDFADKRLQRFLARAGRLARDGRPVSIADLCSQQQFINCSPIVADVVRLIGS